MTQFDANLALNNDNTSDQGHANLCAHPKRRELCSRCASPLCHVTHEWDMTCIAPGRPRGDERPSR